VHNEAPSLPNEIGLHQKSTAKLQLGVYLSHLFFFYRKNAFLRKKKVQAFTHFLPLRILEMKRFKNAPLIMLRENKETGQNFFKIRDQSNPFRWANRGIKAIRILIEVIHHSAQFPKSGSWSGDGP